MGIVPKSRIRGSIVVVLAIAALTSGTARLAPLCAQELPAGVASDLVNRALEQSLEQPPPSPSPIDAVRDRGPAVLAWLGILLAVAILVMGRNKVGETGAPRGGAAAQDDDLAERRAYVDGTRSGADAPATREALKLPPHVAEMLRRSAARRSAERSASSTGNGEAPEGATPPSGGLDYVVPAYDPWKGE
jgi:hypothetical protein